MHIPQRVALASTVALFLFCACSRTVTIEYHGTPSSQARGGSARIAVGEFVDQRGESPHWIATTRGMFYNAFSSTNTAEPVSQVVAKAFRDALRAREMLAAAGAAPYELSGKIVRLNGDQYFGASAVVILEIALEGANGQEVFAGRFERRGEQPASKSSMFLSMGAGHDVRALVEETLQATIGEALDSAKFRGAIAK